MFIVNGESFVLFDSLLPSQLFSVILGRVFMDLTSTKQRIKCLAQGHNAVPPVRLVYDQLYDNQMTYLC